MFVLAPWPNTTTLLQHGLSIQFTSAEVVCSPTLTVLGDAVRDEAMKLSVRAHIALGCRGVSRTDLRYDDTTGENRLIVLEVNTQPGMTPTSLVPEQAAHKGMSFRALVRWILEDASCDR